MEFEKTRRTKSAYALSQGYACSSIKARVFYLACKWTGAICLLGTTVLFGGCDKGGHEGAWAIPHLRRAYSGLASCNDVARKHDLSVCVHLLSACARDGNVNRANAAGIQLIVVASRLNDLPLIKQLTRQETFADLNVGDEEGRTPLIIAASAGNLEVVKVLMQYGANPDVQDKMGCTALIAAVRRSDAKVVKELVNGGCNVFIKDATGKAAGDYAYADGNNKMIEVLSSKK